MKYYQMHRKTFNYDLTQILFILNVYWTINYLNNSAVR